MIEFQLCLFHSAEKIIPRILRESSPFLRSTTSLSHNFGQCKKNVMDSRCKNAIIKFLFTFAWLVHILACETQHKTSWNNIFLSQCVLTDKNKITHFVLSKKTSQIITTNVFLVGTQTEECNLLYTRLQYSFNKNVFCVVFNLLLVFSTDVVYSMLW